MRWWTASCIALATLTGMLIAPSPARATTPTEASAEPEEAPAPRRKRERVRAIEVRGLAMTQILPKPGFGLDAALVVGHPNFQARVGAMLVGIPPFRLGEGSIANVLQVGTLDLCAAKQVYQHQIRMCVGGQAGGMAHIWKGYERPGRDATVWAAGTLRGDYQLRLTRRFGVIGGVGMVLPVVGPSFRAYNALGSPTPMVFPGPAAAYVSVGTTFHW